MARSSMPDLGTGLRSEGFSEEAIGIALSSIGGKHDAITAIVGNGGFLSQKTKVSIASILRFLSTLIS